MLHAMRTTQTRKRAVSCKKKTKQRRKKQKNQYEREMEMGERPMTKKECTLETEVLVDLDLLFNTLRHISNSCRNE